MSLIDVAALFGGGGMGAACRYLIGRFVGERYEGDFPLGTCLINVSGCFALGVVASLLAAHSATDAWNALLVTGFLGGYTTFSTYVLEAVVLLLDREPVVAVLGLVVPIVLGFAAAAAGAGLAQVA